jgi:hypothetical protein
VNLFRQKLAIFIILSWMILIAAVVGYFLGAWWMVGVLLLPILFFRMALPAPGRKWPESRESADDDEKNEWRISRKLASKVGAISDQLGSLCFFFFISITDTFRPIFDFIWNQRQHPLIIAGIGFYVLKLIAWDLRYFSNVPESDLKAFLRD